MSGCTVSLVLCTYGRERELEPLLESLVDQHFRDFEVLMVDQNEDDRLLSLIGRARARGLRIIHLRTAQPNLSAARNLGLRHAHGRWIGFPDDDCWYEPELLQHVVAHFETSSCAVSVARWDEFADRPGLPWQLQWSRSRRFRDRLVTSFMLFFERRIFDQFGGFDPLLGVGQWFGAGEETDLMLRLLRAGERAEFCVPAVVHHPLKPPAAATSAQRASLRQRERGTGALYVLHSLPLDVRCRGLLAPVARELLALCRPGARADLRVGLLESLGRVEGWIGSRRLGRTGALPAVAAPVVDV